MTGHSSQPLVDVIIPVHSTRRPVNRAVASAFDAVSGMAAEQYVVTVAAHHLSEAQVRDALEPRFRDRVHVIEAGDQGRTAAQPRNAALDATRARYVSFLDSDDTLDPGAVQRWVELAERRHSDLVIPFQHHTGRPFDLTPLARLRIGTRVDAVKDRLVYRSTMFGLVRTDTARRVGARCDGSVLTGEDQSFVLALYCRAGRIDLAGGRPGYLMHDDAGDRLSQGAGPIRDQSAGFVRVCRAPWFATAPSRLRSAFALKFLRTNLFAAMDQRLRDGRWDHEDSVEAVRVARTMVAAGPEVADQLARSEHAVLECLQDPGAVDLESLRGALSARLNRLSPDALLTRRMSHVLDRYAPLRINAAAVLQMLRHTWGRTVSGGRRRH